MEGVNEMMNKIPKESMMESEKRLTKCRKCGVEYNYSEEKEKRESRYELCNECDMKKKQSIALGEITKTLPKKYMHIKTDKQDLLKDKLGQSLFITGTVGSGKTVFACNMLVKLALELNSCKYVSFSAFVMELRSSFQVAKVDFHSGAKMTPFDIAGKIAKYNGWLLIDDLGSEKATDYVREIMYYMLNEREQRELPTIITSNFSLSEIDDQIDSRISSRIAGMCEVLNFKGKDKRLNNTIKKIENPIEVAIDGWKL